MFNAKQFFNRLVLAASLSCAAVFAQAEPMKYHVAVNTAGLTGGYFDISVATPTDASQQFTAALSNFAGAFGAIDPSVSHDYLVTANGFSLGNTASGSYLSQMAAFGGILSFDVLFSGPFFNAINGEASNLVFALYGDDFSQLGAGGFDLAGNGATRISLAQGSSSFITINAVTANAVPEPAALLLMLTAFGLMGVMVKRRQA